MKTINVEDLTWQTLQEMKLKWKMPTMNQVVEKLIFETEKKVK
jgi:hypothetical protein